MEESIYIPISALQHFAYCPRQCALIHIEQAWSENYWTAHGRVLHERVDSEVAETRGAMRTERGVQVISHNLRITGKLDMLEITTLEEPKYRPVEYKRGKPKIQDWDRIQLCGQVFCLEEMLKTEIAEAALWYWEARHREYVIIDHVLREQTLKIISAVHELFSKPQTPKAVYKSKLCDFCSLIELCGVKNLSNDHSRHFIEQLFEI